MIDRLAKTSITVKEEDSDKTEKENSVPKKNSKVAPRPIQKPFAASKDKSLKSPSSTLCQIGNAEMVPSEGKF